MKLIQGLDVHKSCRKYPELSFLDRGDGARGKDEEISRSAAAVADDTVLTPWETRLDAEMPERG